MPVLHLRYKLPLAQISHTKKESQPKKLPYLRTQQRRLRSLPETDILQQLQQHKENLLSINDSRLKALAELHAAKRRIKVLEAQLEQARQGQAKQTDLEKGSFISLNSSSEEQQARNAHEQLNYEAAHDNEERTTYQSVETSAHPSVTIVYGTAWDQAYLHFKTQTQGWTQVPGQAMSAGSGDLQGSRTATIITTERIEFVLNNGNDQWDSPDPYGSGAQNYTVEGPGTYYLKSGKLQKLD